MDAPSAAAWLVLGAVLGLLLVAAVAATVLLARRRAGGPPTPEVRPERAPVDDLADFLEHPPGTRPASARTGWTSLVSPPPVPTAPPDRPDGDAGRAYLPLAALSLVALVLVGTAAAVAAGTRPEDPRAADPAPSPRASSTDSHPAPGRTEGRLRAGGLVLEQRAVGVTAAYPELRLSADGRTTRVELRLPTWNCLAAEAPPDPAAAGCARSLVEHAELATPQLVVERDGDRLSLRGEATTWIRPAGSAPERTGRTYELELTVAPGDRDGAVGEVRIGEATAALVEELSELRSG